MSVLVSDNDRELVYQLLEDANHIVQELTGDKLRPVAVRSTLVPLLRKWIVEDGFFKAAKLIRPYEPTFEIMEVPNDIKLCEAGVFEHWMAMIFFGTLGIGAGLLAENFRKTPPEKRTPMMTLYPAKTFFNQKMFFWKGRFYTRHDIIWMHANKLGGVHLDFRRQADEAHINEIKNYFGFEILSHTYQMLRGQDIELARADATRRDHVYDAPELVVLDTARIFAKGVLALHQSFQEVL